MTLAANSTGASTRIASTRGTSGGSSATSRPTPGTAVSRPAPPPRAPSSALCVNSCRNSRPSVAPIARRIASSCARRRVSDSVSVATLTTAINSSRPAAQSSTTSGVRTSPVICCASGVTVACHPSFAGISRDRRSAIAAISARARSSVTSGRSRATTSRNRPQARFSAVGTNGNHICCSPSHPKRGGSMFGITPTIVCGCPPTDSTRPTTDGSPAKRRRQYPSLRITTPAAPGRASAPANSRPCTGLTPSSSK